MFTNFSAFGKLDNITMQNDVTSEVTNACSLTTKDGSIDITINNNNGPYNVKWYRSQKILFGPIPNVRILLKEVNITTNNGNEDLTYIAAGECNAMREGRKSAGGWKLHNILNRVSVTQN